MLAGDLALELGALGVGRVHDDLDAALELFLLQVVGAAVDVQVAVAGVAEVAQADADLLAEAADIDQKGGDLVHRDDHVHFVHQPGLRLDDGEEAGAGRPGGFFVGGGGYHQHVQRLGLLRDLAQLDHFLIELVLVIAGEGHQEGGAHILAAHPLGKDRVAGKGGGGGDDIRVHEFDGLGIEIGKLYLGDEADAVLHTSGGGIGACGRRRPWVDVGGVDLQRRFRLDGGVGCSPLLLPDGRIHQVPVLCRKMPRQSRSDVTPYQCCLDRNRAAAAAGVQKDTARFPERQLD